MTVLLLTPWHWLIIGLVLLIIELFSGSGFLLWLSIAAGIVSLFLWMFPHLLISYQVIIFAVVGIISAVSWWGFLLRNRRKN